MILHRNVINKGRYNHNKTIFPIEDIYRNNLFILNSFGKERDELFKNTKIFINLHKKKSSKFLETLRIHNLIYNRVIIISEHVVDSNDYLNPYVIFTNDFIKTYNDVLNNYDEYYKNIYGTKTNKEIFKKINDEYVKFNNENFK
jgi:hypothetical protein